MQYDSVLVVDFDGRYGQLIAKKVRGCGVHSVVKPYTMPIEQAESPEYKGVILIAGNNMCSDQKKSKAVSQFLSLKTPVIMIGGANDALGRNVTSGSDDAIEKDIVGGANDAIGRDVTGGSNDAIEQDGFASANDLGVQKFKKLKLSPEHGIEQQDEKTLKDFLYDECGCSGGWTMKSFVDESVESLRERMNGRKVLCALSGGVDSSVVAVMINKAIGKNLTCIFVNHGLLRKGEPEQVEKVFREEFDINLICIDAQDRFLNALAGVSDPEKKRKIIGEEFIRVFEEEAKKLGAVDFLAQGTIYPDIIESGIGDGAVIKSHHNVGGLPENIDFKELIEPLRDLFKDEVREAGEILGIPHALVWRQPFPGPGLAIRVIGEIDRERLDILRDADAIVREEIASNGLEKEVNQYFAVLTNMRSVGVSKESRSYDYIVAVRAVSTKDFMSAEWSRLPHELLQKISQRIISEVQHVNRVVYDITDKPPGTIEWE